MPNTLFQIYFHLVSSTKNRVDFITPDIEERVWAYIGGIAKNHRMKALQVGDIDNHAHALISSSTTHSLADIAQPLKGNSSSWIHEEFPHLQKFAWQDGYGVFTVSQSLIPNVIDYIKNQREPPARSGSDRLARFFSSIEMILPPDIRCVKVDGEFL
jgi:putative transposase